MRRIKRQDNNFLGSAKIHHSATCFNTSEVITILFQLHYFEITKKKSFGTYAFLSWNSALPCHQIQCTINIFHWSGHKSLKKRTEKLGKVELIFHFYGCLSVLVYLRMDDLFSKLFFPHQGGQLQFQTYLISRTTSQIHNVFF